MKVHIADDHDLIITGFIALLSAHGIKIAGTSTSGNQLLSWFQENTCDVLILDISMPDINGIEILKYLKQNNIPNKTIVVSAYDETQFIQESIEYGAKGFILKEEAAGCIIEALHQVNNGKSYFSTKVRDVVIDTQLDSNNIVLLSEFLTERELEVLKLMQNAYKPNEIEEELQISKSTIRTLTSRMRIKLNVKTNLGLVILAIKHNLK